MTEMNNNSQTKPISKISIFQSFFVSGNTVNPKRDWKILIILFAVFIIVSLGFDYNMYQKIVGGDMYVSVSRQDLTIENLKSSDLQKILNNFETKKSNIVNLKLENLVDPSL